MWKLIYTLLLYLLLPFFLFFSTFKKKIRKNLLERLIPSLPDRTGGDAIWIHAASLGEAVIAEDLINALRRAGTEDHVVLTTNTYYTRDLLRSRLREEIDVLSLPFDLPLSLRPLLNAWRFKALLLVETEIWPNLIWMAQKRAVPVIIVNGRISDSAFPHYRRFAFFFRGVFSSVDLVLAQSEEQARRFRLLGADPAKVRNTGNLKYARDVAAVPDEVTKEKAITFGSIRERELGEVISVVSRLREDFPDYSVFLVPRELHLVDRIEDDLTAHKTARFSAVKAGLGERAPIIIVDTVGDLIGLYKRSEVAFVGGSLEPYGGQNVLEPLFFGTPVLFGPHMDNFGEIAEEIRAAGAGIVVANGDELYEKMVLILRDGAMRRRMGLAGLAVVQKEKGVMEQAIKDITEIIWKNSPDSQS